MRFTLPLFLVLLLRSECLAQSTTFMDATLNESFPPVTSFPDTTATPQPTIEIPFSPTVTSGSPLPEPTIAFPGDLPSSDEASPCGQAPESQGRAFIRALS